MAGARGDAIGLVLGAPERVWLGRGLLLLSAFALLWAALREAWAAEDAFITFRTIDNLVNGYGLRWNVDERVQTYTHPLWLFANAPVYAVLRHVGTTVVVTGLACTAAAILVLGARWATRPLALLVGFVAALAASRTFVLYSTSGFENALSHLCYAIFVACFLRAVSDGRAVAWGALACAAASAAVTRPDTLLLYGPPLLLLVARSRGSVPWRRLVLGFAPLVGWLAFSTLYYGFPYPNTALAKLNGEIPLLASLRQGAFYAIDLWVRDPAGFVVASLGMLLAARRLALAHAEGLAGVSAGLASLGVGVAAYAGYVLSIGGCFLGGRHWTLCILAGAILLAEEIALAARAAAQRRARGEGLGRPAPIAVAIAAAGALGLVAHGPGREPVDAWVRAHAAVIQARSNGHWLLDETFRWRRTEHARTWEASGRALPAGGVSVRGTIGIAGYFAPREARIVDMFGLADPLVARLPTSREFRKVGHFRRELPAGFVAARGGELDALDPALRRYYEPLRSIASDPLLSGRRLRHWLDFQLGRYDEALADYLGRAAQTTGPAAAIRPARAGVGSSG